MADNGELNLDKAFSYPLLLEEVRHPGATSVLTGRGAGRLSSGPGAAPLANTVADVLHDVLRYRARPGDPSGFIAALKQTFAIEQDKNGKTHVVYTPRSYATQIQADLGAITGAQASIVAQTKTTLDAALPLLDGLRSLGTDDDSDDQESVRSLIRTVLGGLADELSTSGGPRVQRVDSLFETLLGYDGTHTGPLIVQDPDAIRGQVGTLRERFALRGENVNTIEEEQALTNYLLFANYLNTLLQTWHAQKHFFDRVGSDVFYGTQLVLISRALAVVAESVAEVEFAMDSVFLGPAERQALRLPGKPVLTAGELLSWIATFAGDEGPRLIQEGGKDGVATAFAPTVRRLADLVNDKMIQAVKTKPADFPEAYTMPRVTRAVAELKRYLDEVARLARAIKRLPNPVILSLTPRTATLDDTDVTLTLRGDHFQNRAEVRLSDGGKQIVAKSCRVFSDNEIQAVFDLRYRDGASEGDWSVVVVNPDEGVGNLADAFEIKDQPIPPDPPDPELYAVHTDNGQPGDTKTLNISGAHFTTGLSLQFRMAGDTTSNGSGITVQGGVTLARPSRLIATVAIDKSAKPGDRDLVLLKNGQVLDTLRGAFTVLAPPPVPSPTGSGATAAAVTGIDPPQGAQGSQMTVRISGSGFRKGAQLLLGQGINARDEKILPGGKVIEANLSIDAQAPLTERPVIVRNQDRSEITGNVRFTVTPQEHLS